MPYIETYKKKEIKFLFKIINNWMIRDIVRMRNLPILPQSGGNCNFPIVLYIFSCMEFLGYLISDEDIKNKRGSTKKRIWSYMELTFKDDMEKFRKHEPYFVNIFRHGLNHQYFAKGAGISRGKLEVLCFLEKEGLVLDADKFADIFIKSTKSFKSLFYKKKYLIQHPELTNRVYKRFNTLINRNFSYITKLNLKRKKEQGSIEVEPR